MNTASRIEGQTKVLDCAILASSDTIQAATGAIVTGQVQTVSVKGKEVPLELHEVLGYSTKE